MGVVKEVAKEADASASLTTVTPTRPEITHHIIEGRSVYGGRRTGCGRDRGNQPLVWIRRELTTGFSPRTAKQSNGSQIVQKACEGIYEKTGCTGIFSLLQMLHQLQN